MVTSVDAIDWRAEGDRCVNLLRDLLRIRTVNEGTGASGPGDERPAAELLAEFLRAAGVEPRLVEKVPGRTSLVARVKGTGAKPPILLNAHLDVVEADASRWRHDPFGGEIHDGYLWGRGAVDMKHMAAMSACVLALLARNVKAGRRLERDVIFAGVADEEAGSALGSFYLVDEHPDLVRAEYTLGEIGAFSLHLFGRTFYPVQVAEKGICWLRATLEGPPGHGSMPDPDSAVVRLARAVERLGSRRLPVHPTAATRTFFDALARELPFPARAVLSRLTVPAVAPALLDHAIRDKEQRRAFGALVANTATPTVLRAGSKVNVIPGRATVEIDGRTLPGHDGPGFLAEVRAAMGEPGVELEVVRDLPPLEVSTETPLFAHLTRTLRRHDPLGIPVPFIIPGFTDAKAYAKLGSTCYGFAPVRFDPAHTDVVFSRMYHGHDERIPVEGLRWGLECLYDAVSGFCHEVDAAAADRIR